MLLVIFRHIPQFPPAAVLYKIPAGFQKPGKIRLVIAETLRRMGHRVERIGYVVRDKCQDSYFEEKLAERLKQGFDALLS